MNSAHSTLNECRIRVSLFFQDNPSGFLYAKNDNKRGSSRKIVVSAREVLPRNFERVWQPSVYIKADRVVRVL
jgi:hypothetical protein